MDRRHMLAALAVAAAGVSPALAQAQRSSAAADKMGEAEMKHAAMTLAAGTVALETSRVALKKAQNAWVKKFATYEVAEQETMAEILKSMGATPAKLTEKQASMIKMIQDAPADASFDQEYITGQIDGHQDLLKIQEQYISTGKDRHHMAAAKLARGQIKEHIDLAQMIQKEMKA